MNEIRIIPIQGIPEVEAGDNLAEITFSANFPLHAECDISQQTGKKNCFGDHKKQKQNKQKTVKFPLNTSVKFNCYTHLYSFPCL